jgi:hypothetical protein
MVSFLSSSLGARPHYLLLDYYLCCLDELFGYLLVSMASEEFLVCCLNSRTNSGLISGDFYCLLTRNVQRPILRCSLLWSIFYRPMLGLKNY